MKLYSDIHDNHTVPEATSSGSSFFAPDIPKRTKDFDLPHKQTATFTNRKGSVTKSERIPNKQRKILIVQGDWEAEMSLLALDLEDAGHQTGKVVFCAPDLIYKLRGITTHSFRKPLGDFEVWLHNLIEDKGYDTLFLYNHYRPYNQIAWKIADELDLDCWVFELGLIRPNCVMVFDRNNFPLTSIPAKWEEVLKSDSPAEDIETPRELRRVSTPAKLTVFGTNFLLSRITSPLFPNFVDQRDMRLWKHVKHGLIFLWRFMERAGDEAYDLLFSGELSKKYYTVPLQVHSDTQILRNSNFQTIEEFIEHVVASFAKHAPEHTKLVFKVHPMDRGYKDYHDLIYALDEQIGGGRLLYVDRVHLPTLLEHTLGAVNINSSVGISALVHRCPVMVLGKAVYNLENLTFQGKLDEFWTQKSKPKQKHVKQFLNLLLQTSQGRGTLSQRCFDVAGRCKIRWPETFTSRFFPSKDNLTSISNDEKRIE